MVIDPVQLVLLIVIIALTALLIVLGVQVFQILKDVRVTLTKVNRVLDNAGSITDNIDAPLAAVSGLVMGAQSSSLLSIARLVGNFLGKKSKKNKD